MDYLVLCSRFKPSCILFRQDIDVEGSKIAWIKKVLRERWMGTEEIAAAMMKALQVDKNGAVYLVHGRTPIMQWPAVENPISLSFLLIGMIASL